jgi:hypothetical protein
MHGSRPAYYIVGEGAVREPDFLSGGHGCPVTGAAKPSPCSPFKFGRMFPKSGDDLTDKGRKEVVEKLIALGACMSDPTKCGAGSAAVEGPKDSPIPSGYTYLGQFIAHEITHDNTQDLPQVEPDPQNLRSPAIDLDSLYGGGPWDEQSRHLYRDDSPAHLKVGPTDPGNLVGSLDNDLPRDEHNGRALIGDVRNDENLAVAQTAVAFIRFHNKVVDKLKAAGHDDGGLFECARQVVVKHFQWVILHDYLPAIVDNNVLDCVLKHGRRWFKVGRREDLFMPLEFSAAAFRIGHSMVRNEYQWNYFHSRDSKPGSRTLLSELFDQTAFSGFIRKSPNKRLLNHWVIDWRRFFEFPEGSPHHIDGSRINRATRIDTIFDFRLNEMSGFPHGELSEDQRAITVRNLLRGFALGLPAGEEVAALIGEKPLDPEEVSSGPHQKLLSDSVFKGKTPLWYYILKEAELNVSGEGRLGPVGSRIVAETLVGLIENSSHSILRVPKWYPRCTRRGTPGTKSARFGMVDLLNFADVVNPVGGP